VGLPLFDLTKSFTQEIPEKAIAHKHQLQGLPHGVVTRVIVGCIPCIHASRFTERDKSTRSNPSLFGVNVKSFHRFISKYMAFLYRNRTLGRLPANHTLYPRSTTTLRSFISTALCPQFVVDEYLATTVRQSRPQLAPKHEGFSSLLRPLRRHGSQVRRFGNVSASTRFPTCGPLQDCGGDLLLSKNPHLENSVKRKLSRTRRVASPSLRATAYQTPNQAPPKQRDHPPPYTNPTIFQKTTQTPSTPGDHAPPYAKPTRSAVRYIICSNVAVCLAWRVSISQQFCVWE
jgi:hypothetical protein